MSAKIVVGPFNRGLRNDVTPFNVDNDSFPVIQNAYQWRGRVKRKRGTSYLGQLQRFIGTTNGSGNLTVTLSPTPIGNGISSFTVGTNIFTDPGGVSNPVTLLTTGPGTATLNRTTGVLTILGSNATTTVLYFPGLPVMGIEDLALTSTQFPGNLLFDTDYSYNLLSTTPYSIYDVSFYKNPPSSGSYVAKSTANVTPTSWNGADYQQFWTVNYQGALWTTNGIDIPFTGNTISMQFAPSSTISAVSVTPTTLTCTITNCPLVIGDFVFANEWTASGGGDASTLNFQTGYVTASSINTLPFATKTITITFPDATITAGTYTPGILQYLTNRSIPGKDCLRWYDGDPTNGISPYSTLTGNLGWVNFAPPISQSVFTIADLPAAQYYLVGARVIVPFKDRLLFGGVVVQTSTGSPIYLQDTVLFSQNGTPYYTASFTGDPTLATTIFTSFLVPINNTATPGAYFTDSTGFGDWITVGIAEPITTVAPNEDVLIFGFSKTQTRFVYTGSDLIPFAFFKVNSEFGSASTFSTITLDKGVITRGTRGIVITSQTGCERIDLEIPDEVFEIGLTNNGNERFTAVRDFVNEWIYFTYPVNNTNINGTPIYKFPTQTLFFNYRDNSWSIFFESYTTYGLFRKQTGLTWATLPGDLTWQTWTDPWNSGDNALLNPDVLAGNQQGFILIREDDSTAEATSLNIQNISSNVITSPNHCLNNLDYIMISDVQGTVASQLNGMIFQISSPTTNTFVINASPSGTYTGGGYITRLYRPFVQTKQFPVAWEQGRKTRLGAQQYLLTTTQNSQMQLLIYLSQNVASAYNNSTIVPDPTSINNGLIYSTVLYTCTESANLGLTPANTNLQMYSEINPAGTNAANPQEQIWHRVNTSLIGDTVQLGFSLSDAQMTTVDDSGNPISQFSEIELHGFIINVSPSQMLS